MDTVLSNELGQAPKLIPVVPTIDVVVFPHMIVPLLVVDERIVNGVNQAQEGNKLVFLLASKMQGSSSNGAISTSDLYNVGTVATLMRVVQVPEGGIKILVQGVCRASVDRIDSDEKMLAAHVRAIDMSSSANGQEVEAHMRNIKELAAHICQQGQSLTPDFHLILSKMTDPDKIADFVISHLNLDVSQAQRLLEAQDHSQLLLEVYQLLKKEAEVFQVQEKIRSNTRDAMSRSQKEYYLREQLRAIKKELGEDDAEEVEVMRKKMEELPINDEARQEMRHQINRLEKIAPDSMESTVVRNYLDWMFSLPWSNQTTDNLDIQHAHAVLDEDHYGLKDIKERILDFISVRSLKQDSYTPILCFVGAPGTGKTSLGKSIARALGRTYYRISLGGVKDESEIRGHRRTYVGAMPGRFIQAIKKAGSLNPVIIIDELDKIGADFRGDPSAAMLEVLDPEQNKAFYDNYLGVPFDLSHVIFIATANSLDTISGPLRDRLEIIPVEGYTNPEKVIIARNYLQRKAAINSGLEDKNPALSDGVLDCLISHYTREAGVRQLERVINKLYAKATRELVEAHTMPEFTPENIETYLGPCQFREDWYTLHSEIGVCNGLAWTNYGGEMIQVEAVLMQGKGNLILTGHLGDVMKESAQAALSYARAHAAQFNIAHELFQSHDIHIHVPAGAVPKDGPSAGITMLSAILSVLTNRPIDAQFAMTGELNLQGHVMPIGGIKEKILAAKRNGINHIILPEKNKNDLQGLDDIMRDIDIIFVGHADEVLRRVLLKAEVLAQQVPQI